MELSPFSWIGVWLSRCRPCPSGTYSKQLSDDKGLTYICEPCAPGWVQVLAMKNWMNWMNRKSLYLYARYFFGCLCWFSSRTTFFGPNLETSLLAALLGAGAFRSFWREANTTDQPDKMLEKFLLLGSMNGFQGGPSQYTLHFHVFSDTCLQKGAGMMTGVLLVQKAQYYDIYMSFYQTFYWMRHNMT